jgi:hypothetical protein
MPNNRPIIFLLGACAALHVWFFSAAFPFFSVVDEQMHLDLVVHYAHADPPRKLTPPTAEALPFLAIYGTPEYIWSSATVTGGVIPPPPWQQPVAAVREHLLAKQAAYQTQFRNHEAASPPLYYSLAGAWWKFGQLLGFDGARLLYWLRFLNVIFVVGLVWLGRRVAQKTFPENNFIQLAVPAFIAFLPQTIFYAINNDGLSPLAFGLAFLLLLKLGEAEIITARLGAATGLALAAAFLTKLSLLPLLAVAGIFLAWKMFRLAKSGTLKKSLPAWSVLAACAVLPATTWMVWCKINFGDYTGSALKIQFLGWTNKPFAEWFQHPIFTASGFWFFVKGNLATFWQGEMLWHRQPLALPALNLFYVGLTLLLLAAVLFALVWRAGRFTAPQRAALWFGWAGLAAMFAFFALLSVKYDFHDCFYPSREKPFFVSGRLLLGMLLPFLLLIAVGLDQLLGKLRERLKLTMLGAFLLFMLGLEICVTWPIFPNAYNWFHL